MTDIELVIKIPESRYRLLQTQARTNLGREKLDEFAEAVLNGTPLPKGHGDLIDRGELKKIIQENDPLSMTGFSVGLCDIYRATPIIEKDGD